MMISPGYPPRFSMSAVFVDGGYIDKLVTKRFPGKQLAVRPFLGQLLDILNSGRAPDFLKAVRTYWYDAVPEDTEGFPDHLKEAVKKNVRFLDYIDEHCNNVDVKRGLVKYSIKEGLRQKGVDVFMGADIALTAWTGRVSDIVLVAQDGDFVPSVTVAKSAMVQVHLITDSEGLSLDLKKACDTFYLKLGDWLQQSKLIHDPSEITDGGGVPSSLSSLPQRTSTS